LTVEFERGLKSGSVTESILGTFVGQALKGLEQRLDADLNSKESLNEARGPTISSWVKRGKKS
jgi:hypothetical protein